MKILEEQKTKIANLILDKLQNLRGLLNLSKNLSINEKTELFGANGILDSLGLVTFVVEIEQDVRDKFDVEIVLADERAMSQKHSPFRSVEKLAGYVNKLIMERRNV